MGQPSRVTGSRFYPSTSNEQLSPGNVWALDKGGRGYYQRPKSTEPAIQAPISDIGRSLLARDAEIGPGPIVVRGEYQSPESAVRGLAEYATGYSLPILGLSVKNPLKKPTDVLKWIGSAPKYASDLQSVLLGGPVQSR